MSFSKRDLQDTVKTVTEESVRKDYTMKGFEGEVYQAYIPVEDMPTPKLVEELEPRGEFEYPWEELRPGRQVYPPVKVLRKADGTLSILDGNHRARFWKETGMTHIPAWVVDEMPTESAESWMKKYDTDPEFRAEQNKWAMESYRPDVEDPVADPKIAGAAELAGQAVERLRKEGHDGIVYRNEIEGGTSYVAFDPGQIKHALPHRVFADFSDIGGKEVKPPEPPGRVDDPETFRKAVGNTPGAKWTPDGLELTLVRYQKPEQAGEPSVRTGVFFMPEEKSPYTRYYKKEKAYYGGEQKIQGRVLFENPLVVKGASGGAVPARAYNAVKGKDAYLAMGNDVTKSVLFRHDVFGKETISGGERIQAVISILQKYGVDADAAMASNILSASTAGNTLRYAIMENIVAHAVREAGHDAVVGYSKKLRGAPRLTEVFDVRMPNYPAEGWVRPEEAPRERPEKK